MRVYPPVLARPNGHSVIRADPQALPGVQPHEHDVIRGQAVLRREMLERGSAGGEGKARDTLGFSVGNPDSPVRGFRDMGYAVDLQAIPG